MGVLSTTIEFKGSLIKVENSKVYMQIMGRYFGRKSSYIGISWKEIVPSEELKELLIKEGLVK